MRPLKPTPQAFCGPIYFFLLKLHHGLHAIHQVTKLSRYPLLIKVITYAYLVLMSTCLIVTAGIAQTQSSCVNADFEQNNFSNWTGMTGSCCPINIATPGLIGGRHTIMTGNGTDPHSLGQIPVVAPGGLFSARLGNDNTGGDAEQLTYTFTVSSATALFIYRYAVVLEDPSHSAADQPRFQIRVIDSIGNLIPCGTYNVVASGSIPGFQNNGDIRFKTWTTVGIELSAYMNQSLTIEFSTADCGLGGHFGYAYVDCFCYPLIISSDVCPGVAAVTLNAPIGFASYLWNTGQSTSSINVTNPIFGAQYTVTMTSVTGCTVSLSTVINPTQLFAGFTETSNCQKGAIFTDSSYVINGSAPGTWLWNFGDGDTSTEQSPVHQYALPGVYQVTMISGNTGGCADTVTRTVNIVPSPDALFAHSGASCTEENAFFTDQSVIQPGNISGWLWNFGDGDTSTLQNPVHAYALPGTYQVLLTVQGSNGCTDTLTMPVTSVAALYAGFGFSAACDGLPVYFYDSSYIVTGSITAWRWSFGDGAISLLQNPSHTYSSIGNYNVMLIVTGDNGCMDTIQSIVSVTVSPQAAFTVSSVCDTSLFSLTDASIQPGGAIASWSWSFGDGGTSLLQNPVHNYASAGSYLITLVVIGNNGCYDSVSQMITTRPIPVASMSYTTNCSNTPVEFTNTSTVSSGSLMGFHWMFGDGGVSAFENPTHLYGMGGTFTVTLIVSTSMGCTDTLQEQVLVFDAPVIGFTAPVACAGQDVQFTDQTFSATNNLIAWAWNFGDHSTSGQQHPVHEYLTTGDFYVTLWVYASNGCNDSITKTIHVYKPPQSDFTAAPRYGCTPVGVLFNDKSLEGDGNITTRYWDFGDGNLAHAVNPFHKYETAGIYPVSLVVLSSTGCKDTLIMPEYIESFPAPVAGFRYNPEKPTMLEPGISVIDLSTGSDRWYYSFGDGTDTEERFPLHSYKMPGNYLLLQAVMNNYGCRDTASEMLTVEDNYAFYVPAAFSPNGDGLNDLFIPSAYHVHDFSMEIYNRWGTKIYETDSFDRPWNGVAGSDPAPGGAYVYRITFTDVFDTPHVKYGKVSLLR